MKALALVLLACLLLAGCAAKPGGPTGDPIPDPGNVAVTASTGGIRGVVVDQAIRPLKGADVEVRGAGVSKNLTTDESGGFTLGELKPGTYFVKASKPLYDTQQQGVEVKAGVTPPVTKIQLNQLIFAKPYLQTLKFKGFIFCSLDAGGVLFSEECGEGLGVPCVAPPAPCGRVGGQSNNHIQTDFHVDNDAVKSLVVETYWTPTVGVATTGNLRVIVATGFICNPTCAGTYFYDKCGGSPLLQRDDKVVAGLKLNATTKLSHFVWACGQGGTLPADLEFQQDFQLFVSSSYYLPLPADWSFVKGSPDPFA